MNGYEEELRSALKSYFDAGSLRHMGSSDEIFDVLNATYPVCGSKIDWSKLPGAIEVYEPSTDSRVRRFCAFFDQMARQFELQGQVRYAGDSCTDFALEASHETMREVLSTLLEIPHHHYFVDPDCSWCMCLTIEGYMAFGRAGKVLPFTR